MSREKRLSGEDISVVIPSYNHGRYIESAVMSVINQTSPNSEIVIVDDGSTDNSQSICAQLGRQYPQIKLVNQVNQGAHCAINHGVNLAKGNFIAVLNSDDLFESTKLESCLEILNSRPEVDLVVGGLVLFIDEHGQVNHKGISVDWHRRATNFLDESKLVGLSLLNENFVVTTSNMTFSKSFWQSARGFQPLRYCHDLEFLLAAVRNTSLYICRDKPHIRYRVHAQNTIKEQIDRVRIEIAAVIAQAIAEGGLSLIGDDGRQNISLFRKFLRNKNLSDLVLLLVMKYFCSADKTAYFENISDEEKKENYSALLD